MDFKAGYTQQYVFVCGSCARTLRTSEGRDYGVGVRLTAVQRMVGWTRIREPTRFWELDCMLDWDG